MEIIELEKLSQIKRYVNVEKNFISFVRTSWHLDNLVSVLLIKNIRNGVVVVLPQGNINNDTRYRLKKKNFSSYAVFFSKVIFIHDVDAKLNILGIFIRMIRSYNKKIFLFVSGSSDRIGIRIISSVLCMNCFFNVILIDEGLGSYLSNKDFYVVGYNRIKVQINDIVYKLFVRPIVNMIVPNIANMCLFQRVDNKLVCNEDLSKKLIQLYFERNIKHCENNLDKTIILFKDFGITNKAVDNDIYSKLFSFFNKQNYIVYIKKHPNDIDLLLDKMVESYRNISILDSDKSGEDIVAIYRPRLIVGGYTTVLFSSSNIFKIPALSFMPFYVTIDSIDDVIKKNILFFKEKFQYNEYISFYENLNGLFEKINSIMIG